MNIQGFAGDLAYNLPYEFVSPAANVLYPMGCGMLIRRSVWSELAPLDTSTLKWYDDTELGIRVWLLGFRVVVAPYAFFDHQPNTSDQFIVRRQWQTTFFFERARLRTVFKFFPRKMLGCFVAGECKRDSLLLFSPAGKEVLVRILAWLWNLAYLSSLLKIRGDFFSKSKGQFWDLVDNSTGRFPPLSPANLRLRPNPEEAGASLVMGSAQDASFLHFGWYEQETDGQQVFRWSDQFASALFSLSCTSASLRLFCRIHPSAAAVKLSVRHFGDEQILIEHWIEAEGGIWQEQSVTLILAPGLYEVLLASKETAVDGAGRRIGMALSWLEFSETKAKEAIKVEPPQLRERTGTGRE